MGIEIVVETIGNVAKALFGSRNERLIRAYRVRAEEITVLEPEFQALSDEALLAKTPEFRERVRKGESLDDLLPEAFSAAREAAKRTIWLGYQEAPADHFPDVQTVVRMAMRGEASLIDPSSGQPIDLHGLYGMRPYDVQLIGGIVLHEGKIAELATGEGKTLVATLAAYLNALSGHPVHVVSVNDYLVRRDCEWNRPIFRRLGLTVGAIQADMNSQERQAEYACDVTYGTNNEFGFDYLRDNMKVSRAEQVQGELAYAIVDECDSVLIDEARTPLIISGPAFDSTDKYSKADAVARQLKEGRDFTVKEKEHQCPMTEDGGRRAEELVGVGSFYVAGNMEWPHLIDQALRAHYLYKLDKQYVVRGEDVVIVDEFTGRLMNGRQWSDGLHQAVEAKEKIRIKEETQTLATITLQNFFRMYKKLSGMTGTAMTEAAEFDKIYKLETVSIPTNRPLSRVDQPDVIYRTEKKEKFGAIVEEIKACHERGRPILVGTTSIEKSERLSGMLERTYGIPHEVLNAKHHEKEAQIVAKAGQQHVGPDGKMKGNVTIATNMAGRGTDIKLGPGVVWPNCFGPWDAAKQVIPSDFGNKCCVGCPEYDPKTNCAHCFKPKIDPDFPRRGRTECVADPPCGLHVIGTERHEARRIDNQLRGRTGRQGDPGSSRFFLSLEDDLMRIFAHDWVSSALQKLGMEEGMALQHRWLSRGIENAQKKVEERNFDIRKHLLEYDEVMDQQRKIFYGRRQQILESQNLRPLVWDLLAESVESACDNYLSEAYSYETVAEWARRTLAIQVDADQIKGKTADEIVTFLQDRAVLAGRDAIEETLGEFIPEELDEMGEEPEEPGDRDEEAEEETAVKADYRSLAAWAETRLGVHMRELDLKRLSRSEIEDTLGKASDKRVETADFTPIEGFLEPSFRLAALANWANKKFEFGMAVSDFQKKPREEVVDDLLARLEKLYDQKELTYPIESAIEEYIAAQMALTQQNFDGLAVWASRFYLTDVKADDLRHRDVREVRRRLLEVAADYVRSDRLRQTVVEGLKAHLPAAGQDTPEAWQALSQWAMQHLTLEITPEQFVAACRPAPAPREPTDGQSPHPFPLPAKARGEGEKKDQPSPPTGGEGGRRPGEGAAPAEIVETLLVGRAQADRRSRMTELERLLLLQVHDTSWKDHLLVMDHLKSGVGLRSYGQLNPLIEFKKEGLASFERMLETTCEKFTDLFFKARWVRQEALARIWAGQSTEHAEASSAYAAQQQSALDSHQQAQMAQEGETVKTIIRDKPKVGRNDPCPCGSGKKYKKCCGKNA